MNGEGFTAREPMATRVNELSQRSDSQVDRPSTMLEAHSEQLSNIESGLERALLQYSNMLDRMRGAQPTSQGTDKALQPESMAQRLANQSDRLQSLTNMLNEMADELNHLI